MIDAASVASASGEIVTRPRGMKLPTLRVLSVSTSRPAWIFHGRPGCGPITRFRSRSETMPTSLPFSTTGRCRMFLTANSENTLSLVSSGETVTTRLFMSALTFTSSSRLTPQ